MRPVAAQLSGAPPIGPWISRTKRADPAAHNTRNGRGDS